MATVIVPWQPLSPPPPELELPPEVLVPQALTAPRAAMDAKDKNAAVLCMAPPFEEDADVCAPVYTASLAVVYQLAGDFHS
ncbi:MAG: hypothetical protein JO198_08150 [Candidatus Dormibacteraeota bacterium]|nr:hypothetical protein [Candidatus Dormibacteraeota bacterium]